MKNEDRPDPDRLLARVERDNAKARRGRLKIFFGAAAGVGKTYAMLQAARERRAENQDVVVGWVETHCRQETLALLEGLEVLPTRRIEYKGAVLHEFDIDAAMKRRPAIILVDELAHSNAPGSLRLKRWQDIQELLNAGIDVYSALNVQHLEGLKDDVSRITGIRVWETVPDSVFEDADEVELIDLPPDDLLNRLKEGKIYLPQQTQEAIHHFFRKGNLIALRELALRRTANRVDTQMLDYREGHSIREVWEVTDRILVCIGANPLAERLVRAGKRLAVSLRAEWIVAYVETPQLQRMPAEQRDAVSRGLRLAEQLGAETVTLIATEISPALIGFSRERNINKMVLGKPSRRGWRRCLQASVVDALIGRAHNISIYLLGSPLKEERMDQGGEPLLFKKGSLPGLRQYIPAKTKKRFKPYAWAVAVTLLSTLAGRLMFGWLEPANLVMVYLLGVVFVATRFGRGPSILASVLGVVCQDLLFVAPYYSFLASAGQFLITLATMLLIGIVISNLLANIRSQAKIAAHRERRASVLYAMSKELAAVQTENDAVRIAVHRLHAEFGGRNTILFPDNNGRMRYPSQKNQPLSLCGASLTVAQWVFDHNEIAGQGTNTLSGAAAIYFPFHHQGNVLGVLALLPVNPRQVFLPEQHKLLETFLQLIGQTLARIRLAEQARLTNSQIEAEHLRNSLLNAISHELCTPLASIIGSASTLAEDDNHLQPRDKLELSRTIVSEAERMSSLVYHILDMARLDAGALDLNKQWHPLEEVK